MAEKAERENRAAHAVPADRTASAERTGRTKARILFLVGALLPIFLSGLMFARAAQAATTQQAVTMAPVATAASAAVTVPYAPAAHSAPTASATSAAAAATAVNGPCKLPVIGDLGSLAGLCQAGAGLGGDINNICSPGTEEPEQASSGLDAMISVPGGTPSAGSLAGGKGTLYDQYGTAGQDWSATNLQCSDMTSLIGNQTANMTFNFAKALDRLTITVYQSAAGNNILGWLSGDVDNLISALGRAIYFPYLAPVVILGAIWLAWQGLIRKRATRTIEGTIWMVIACAAAIWLIGRPGDFTNIGTTVSNSVTNVMNVAFANLPAPQDADCLPVGNNDPQSVAPSYAFNSGNGLVDQNANELWSVLVCKPWLNGEFGTTVYTGSANPAKQTIVDQYGRQLLWSQAIAVNEAPTPALIAQKQAVYRGIAQQIQTNYPADYALFQGNQWTTRLEVGFSALFAAVAAGLLVLLIALTLILLKLGFLLLLVAGPFFLIIGTHPGFGRVIAMRWFEMLVGVLLKQIAVALTLSVLLYCYSLIMGTSDTTLPWALKIIMIALVTVAVFIYRRPFQHLFSAVGYGLVGSEARADGSLREATFGFRRATAGAVGATAGVVGGTAGAVMPGVGAGRGARWARRFGESSTPAGEAGADGAASGMAGAAAAAGGVRSSAASDGGAGRSRPDALPGGGGGSGGPGSGSGGSGAGSGRGRAWPETGYGASGRSAPPLPLSGPGGSGSGSGSGSGPGAASAGWARSSGSRSNTGPLPRASATGSGGSPGSSAPASPPTPSPWTRPFRRGK
jgi:TrbL/VirB6 plasmid conjugal transfer protein